MLHYFIMQSCTMPIFNISALFAASARRRIVGLLLGWSLLCPPAVSMGAAPSDSGENAASLLKVVVLTRHGVRTPTQSQETLQSWTMHPWPVWPAWTPPGLENAPSDARGRLTERGAQLVSALWRQQRRQMNDAGLLPSAKCPNPADVFVYADLDERTRATALALLDGLAPGCGLRYATASSTVRSDPLFHPVRAGTATLDATDAVRRIQATGGSDLAGPARELRAPLELLADIAGPLPPHVRRSAHLSDGATLADLPTTLRVDADGRAVHVDGALGIAAGMAEIFLLEYAQWPDRPAGWGRVDAAVLERLMPLHVRVFNAVNRDPFVARAGGGALLTAMAAALDGTHPNPRVNAARLTVFVGHDTNIAQVGGLLGLQWKTPGYAPCQTPPAGALVLSLWRKGSGEYVRAHFLAQPPAVLQAENPDAEGVDMVEISVPRCTGAPETGSCSRQGFMEATRAALTTPATERP